MNIETVNYSGWIAVKSEISYPKSFIGDWKIGLNQMPVTPMLLRKPSRDVIPFKSPMPSPSES